MKSIAIHQPNYIPWLGYFYKISQADIFVFLDDVQFSNQGMHNYQYMKTPDGPFRIKIPVFQTLGDKINEVRMKNDLGWREKHLALLQTNYKDADYFDEVYADFKKLIYEDHQYLPDLNISIIKYICNKFGIKSDFLKSSDLNISSVKEAKIIDICTTLGADIYYSGTGAREYQNEQKFLEKDIQLKYSEYNILTYKQQHSGFQSNVTVVDFLMNCGYRWDMVIANQNSATNGNRELH